MNFELKYVNFKYECIFQNLSLLSILSLRECIFINSLKINDLRVRNIKDRETARILKDSSEKQNNIIEANKYYAIEMKKREEELKPSKDFFEWLVFKIHGLSSNHSQDWTLSLAWIILFGMLLTVFKVNLSFDINVVFCLIPFLYIKIEKYMFLVFYGLYFIFMKSLDKSPLDDFATNINPFSIMTSADKLIFTELLFKIIIAFLIYQFIISIRQNTRRK